MRLHLWGSDFRRSQRDFRSHLFLPPEKRREFVQQMISFGFTDLVYIATCNRIEFYTTAPDYFVDTRPLWQLLLSTLGLSKDNYYHGYHMEGKSAVRHLMRVASSLESLVIGEPQILGQLKEAIQWNRKEGLPVQAVTERCFQLAFETAKYVRTQTGLGEKPVSIASLGICRAKCMEEEIPFENVVVVGRGTISRQVVEWIQRERREAKITWVNRNSEKLRPFSEPLGIEVLSLAEFLERPPSFSHLFTATASADPIFGDEFFAKLSGSSRSLVVDFAQPPDVKVEELPRHICLVGLEDLEQEAQQNARLRAEAVEAAEGYIEERLREFYLVQKEAPILKDFSAVEPLLLENLKSTYSNIEMAYPEEMHGPMRELAERVTRRNMHESRVYLRQLLRKISEPSEISESFEAEGVFG